MRVCFKRMYMYALDSLLSCSISNSMFVSTFLTMRQTSKCMFVRSFVRFTICPIYGCLSTFYVRSMRSNEN